MTTKKNHKLLALLCVAIAGSMFTNLALAHEASVEKVHKTKKKTMQAQRKTFVALPSKANGTDVAAEYRLENTPQVGQALTITLQMMGSIDSQYSVTADSGLLLRTPIVATSLPANQKSSTSIVVVPQTEGLFYVNLFIQQGDKRSAVSIPVQVGGKGLPIERNLKTEPNGEKVIVMPAK